MPPVTIDLISDDDDEPAIADSSTMPQVISEPNAIDDVEPPSHVYRSAKSLPYQLREHCTIYFEEGLCMSNRRRFSWIGRPD